MYIFIYSYFVLNPKNLAKLYRIDVSFFLIYLDNY